VQDLTEPKAKLPGLIAAGDALDLGHFERHTVIPREVEVRRASAWAKRGHALRAHPGCQGILGGCVCTQRTVDQIGVDREGLSRLGGRRLVRLLVVGEHFGGWKRWARRELFGHLAPLARLAKVATASWSDRVVL
jgi:hypothetical protein